MKRTQYSRWLMASVVATVLGISDEAGAAEPDPDPVLVHWLESSRPAFGPGSAWGMPWPEGILQEGKSLAVHAADGTAVPAQSWPLAYWPDGSIKWTGLAVGAVDDSVSGLAVSPGEPALPEQAVIIRPDGAGVVVGTGAIECRLPGPGDTVIESIIGKGRVLARDAVLIGSRETRAAADAGRQYTREEFGAEVRTLTVEQDGPVRAVVKLDGVHRAPDGRDWLPFTLRLYFHAGSDAVRIMHSFVYDADPAVDFIAGLGLRATVPMRDDMHDRHVRFAGETGGVWGEAVRQLSGLRRNPGEEVKHRQWLGEACPPVSEWDERVQRGIQYIPLWNDFSLAQTTADAFTIRKRTGATEKVCWLDAGFGQRAAGSVYVGGPSGGLAGGIRDFWQSYPSQLDIRGAATDEATLTLWLWAPDAAAMDMRSYEVKIGQDTYAQQLDALNITYEDYEHEFDTPVGIARTSELTLWAVPATPDREAFADFSRYVQRPPQLVCRPERYLAVPLFGGMWSLPDRSTPARAKVEDHLQGLIDYYALEVDQRRWYGFWNFGDIMHTYDPDRHVWRYDVGGYAWDNSELSPDLWLWYSFLRSGRDTTFRLAEAMTRHTGEVDVYHLGRFAGLGSRHNVLHWGCSAKQVRVSLAAFRRIFYYLTTDERTGDLMREVVDSDLAVQKLNPVRKLPSVPENPHPGMVGIGPDWYAFAGNWLTEWERTRNPVYRDKIIAGMESIGAMPYGMFSGPMVGYEPETGTLHHLSGDHKEASHLSVVFGGVEICAELIDLFDVPSFEKAWFQYCRLYNASREERLQATGEGFRIQGLPQAHSRLTAYLAYRTADPALAARAWQEFLTRGYSPPWNQLGLERQRVDGADVLRPIEDLPWMATNDAAQWGLAAIQNLALIGEHMPHDLPNPE